eukprot:gb/GECG01014400.1/.p1 GENE.gb/GECG01014400.1/~~gb/GECG01014400.1/.p1  ORF type:complete len:492 (+),score=78.15 gb/GECG01014400.1/:1-1476(+)
MEDKMGKKGGKKNQGSASDSREGNALVERILDQVYYCYSNPEKASKALGEVSLETMGKAVGLDFIHPRKRITVLIVGNHSAGKSSFINWYIQKQLQRTGMAVETKGFGIVTFGKRDQILKGQSALQQHKHIQMALGGNREPGLSGEDVNGFYEHLEVNVSTSKAREFPMVDFIDTPGLVDGGIVYPFDPNKLIERLAAISDIIFVFMDPHGGSNCTRTMSVVRALNDAKHHRKMRYFLTKADSVNNREDLSKLLVQLTKRLSDNVSNTHGLEVPTMWIPQQKETADTEAEERRAFSDESNSLYRLVDDIDETIQSKVQTNMNQLKADCESLIDEVEKELTEQARRRAKQSAWWKYKVLFMWLLLPILFFTVFLDTLWAWKKHLPSFVAQNDLMQTIFEQTQISQDYYYHVMDAVGLGDTATRLLVFGVLFLIISTLAQLVSCRMRNLPVKSKQELDQLYEYKVNAATMLAFHDQLYREYISDSQMDEYSDE